MNTKLLLVEPSATMRYVLEDFARSLGYEVEALDDYRQAKDALTEQFRAFEGDFAGVLLGWPAVPDDDADVLAKMLEQDEFIDMPVIVMSTDMRSSTRAWVAGRESTSLLQWKEYQSVEGQLTRLLAPAEGGKHELNPKFDNADIHLLLVDDSISIRHALRDLFELQGYRVSLAATHDEAVAMARRERMDLAILDFYLQDGTGDVLCRELTHDPATGNLTCAMLTGTYSDHIIKRSLRAGAIECMFKNESSELILSRVDALSRIIRQREALQSSRASLDKVVDTLAGATLLVNAKHKISYVSPKAQALLQQASDEALIGKPITNYLGNAGFAGQVDQWHEVMWSSGDDDPLSVRVRKQAIGNANEILLYLKPGIQKAGNLSANLSAQARDKIKQQPHGQAFIDCLGEYLMQPTGADLSISLLLVEVGDKDTIASEHEFEKIEQALLAVYKRPGHVSRLDANRYGILLRHSTVTESYLMTRKLMQLCNDVELSGCIHKLSTSGCLVGLDTNAALSSSELLQRALLGLDVMSGRASNQALLLDPKKMLPVYPASDSHSFESKTDKL